MGTEVSQTVDERLLTLLIDRLITSWSASKAWTPLSSNKKPLGLPFLWYFKLFLIQRDKS